MSSILSFDSPDPSTAQGASLAHRPRRVGNHLMRLMRVFAGASAVCVLAMVGLSWWTGLNVQHFEHVSSPASWEAAFLAQGASLRGLTVIDDAFVACYLVTTVLLVRLLRARAAAGAAVHSLGPWIVMGAGLVGLLDLIENHHVLALLRLVEQGGAVDPGTMVQRELLSSVKWVVGHIAFAMMGVALWFDSWAWRLFRGALIAVQLPVGVAALVLAGTAAGEWLGWLKLLDVSLGFLALATLPWPRAGDSGEPV